MPAAARRHLLVACAFVVAVAGSALMTLVPAAGGADRPVRLAAGSDVRAPDDVRRMLAVAEDHWRRRSDRALPAECEGGLEVREGGPARGTTAGYAEPPCRIWLNPDAFSVRRGAWRASLCDVVVHEVGHLLGQGHSARPYDVMAAELPGEGWPLVAECALSVARTAR